MWMITENETLHGTLILLFFILLADLFAVPFIGTFRCRPLMLCALRQECHTEITEEITPVNYRFGFFKLLTGSSWCLRGRMTNAHVCVQPFIFLSYDSIPASMRLRHQQSHCGPHQVAHCDVLFTFTVMSDESSENSFTLLVELHTSSARLC